MKVGFIGDTHGRNYWKEFVKDETIDIWVFVGDYVDEDLKDQISDEEMIENLQDIIDFKIANMDKVFILRGNHDNNYAYPSNDDCRCSRFRSSISQDLFDIFNLNGKLFQNAWQYKDLIVTHAGIQHDWFINDFDGNRFQNIADQLNNPKDKMQYNSLFNVGTCRGGWAEVGGIFWADISELSKPLKGYTQIVGHNRVSDFSYYNNPEYGSILFIDCLGKKKQFKILEL